jgi:hypothetical protein
MKPDRPGRSRLAGASRRVRRARAAEARAFAAPISPYPGFAATRRWWAAHRQRRTPWRLTYLGLVGLTLGLAVAVSPAFFVVGFTWLAAGALTWAVDTVYQTDDRERRLRHATATTPVIAAGYRLRPDAGQLEPELSDQVALLSWLHARAAVVTRPVLGHHRGATRRTYRVGLRALAREWARSRGRPVRQGERVLAEIESLGLVRRVRISQVNAYRLAHPTIEDALRALELRTGRRIVDWALGPS